MVGVIIEFIPLMACGCIMQHSNIDGKVIKGGANSDYFIYFV